MAVSDRVFIAVPADEEPWHHLGRLLAQSRGRLEKEHRIKVELEEGPATGANLICRFQPAAAQDAGAATPGRFWLGEVLTEFFLVYWEADLVRQLVAAANPGLSPKERAVICRAALRLLAKDSADVGFPCRQFVHDRLLEYLDEHDEIHLEGFLTFRLQPYVQAVEAAVEEASSRFRQDGGYRDFLQLLRLFVDSQPARAGLVHVFSDPRGRFALADENGFTLDDKTLAAMVKGVGGKQVHYGDLLLSALISMAPREVLLHTPTALPGLPPETVKAIDYVFAGRVFSCRGCRTCRGRLF